MKTAQSPDFAVRCDTGGDCNGADVDALMPEGVKNPGTAEQAVQRALSHVGSGSEFSGFSLRFVTLAYGYGGGLAMWASKNALADTMFGRSRVRCRKSLSAAH